MESRDSQPPPDDASPAAGTRADRSPRWLPFVLPLAVYLLAGSLEPQSPEQPGGTAIGLAIPYSQYPLVYTVKIVLTLAAVAWAVPVYRRFPLRLGWLGIVVGVVGVAVWVGLCYLQVEQRWLAPLLEPLKLDWLVAAGGRSAFNPLEQLRDQPLWAYGFLAIRFFGLVVIVPLAEEFFYRGFLMPFVTRDQWWTVPQGEANRWALLAATLLPMTMHPAELLAAAVWFSMITWLFLRTRNVWECVVAHAVTNLLLGVYVIYSGAWQLM